MSSPGSDQEILNDSDEIDILALMRRLIDKKWQITGISLLGFFFAIIYLHMATPVYSVELKITPAPASSATGGLSKKLGSLGGLAALAGVSVGSSSGDSATPFDLYLEELKSRELANELAKDPQIMTTIYSGQWDKESKTWQKPQSILSPVKSALKSVLGIPQRPWRAPNGVALQGYMEAVVAIIKPSAKDPPITIISMEHPDPAFAIYFLSRMNELADMRIRRVALARATEYAAYLSAKMNSAIIAEHRKDLSEALSEQEKSIMSASSSLPYAAVIVQMPTASDRPVKPSPVLVLVLGMMSGLIIGALLALFNFKKLFRDLRAASDKSAQFL